jgi:hypothetical protein
MSADLLTPTDATADASFSLYKFDFEAELKKYDSHPKNFIACPKYRLGKSALRMQLSTTLFTNGITVNTLGEGKNKKDIFSLGLTIDNETDLEALETASESLAKILPDDYTITETLKEDKFYLKLKTDDAKKTFKVKSNITINPRKPHDSDMSKDDTILLIFELGAYINFADKKAGLMITPLSLIFEKEEDLLPPAKKHKV